MKSIRVALIGAGLMGRFHGRTLAGMIGARLDWVIDQDLAAAQQVAAWSESGRASQDLAAASAAEVDAWVIVTPAQTHADLIVAGAEAGKAIFCEKPLATDVHDLPRIEAALARHAVPFQIGFQRRFDPGIARLLQRLKAGELGQVETFRSVTSDPYGPDFAGMERAAGIFHDTLSHDVDLALAVGGEVEEVFTRAAAFLDSRFLELGKPDTSQVSLRFRSGALGVIENRLRSGYGYETVLEVGGSLAKGVVRADAVDALTLYRDARSERAHVPWFLERFAAAYRSELEHFIDACHGRTQANPGFAQGAAVMRVCAAVERSFQESRPVSCSAFVASG